ncbi:hypothetical protein BaRGS_00006464 [Batillaria attramentaria]|uniref:Uncharacterized protein n=1 Tax=Batillaria attramentaria TaxID=370345 RepID=A0ABD0LSP6_9CAEN
MFAPSLYTSGTKDNVTVTLVSNTWKEAIGKSSVKSFCTVSTKAGIYIYIFYTFLALKRKILNKEWKTVVNKGFCENEEREFRPSFQRIIQAGSGRIIDNLCLGNKDQRQSDWQQADDDGNGASRDGERECVCVWGGHIWSCDTTAD